MVRKLIDATKRARCVDTIKEASELIQSFADEQTKDLREENEKLRKALQFYADEDNWKGLISYFNKIDEDDMEDGEILKPTKGYMPCKYGGKRARAALERQNGN